MGQGLQGLPYWNWAQSCFRNSATQTIFTLTDGLPVFLQYPLTMRMNDIRNELLQIQGVTDWFKSSIDYVPHSGWDNTCSWSMYYDCPLEPLVSRILSY